MKLELYGKAIDPRRFILVVAAPLACFAVAAAMFLPASIMRLALMLLFALPFIFLCFDRPAIIFFLAILILFSNLDVYAPFRLYRYLVVFLLASFAIAVADGRRIVTHHPHLIALSLAFAILAFQSLSVAREYDLAAQTLDKFLRILVAIAIVAQFTRDRREFRRFLLVLAGGILLSDYLPFIVHPPDRFASFSMLANRGVVRYEGFVFEPNGFALFQLFLIPVLVFFFGARCTPRGARSFFALMILASIGVLVLSFSRGGFIGLASLLVTLVVIERRNKPLFLFGLSLIAAGIAIVPGVYWERIGSIFDFATKRAGDFAIDSRLETMRVAFHPGLAHPLLGVGIGNFIPSAAYFTPHGSTVHNIFLGIFSELGFTGLLLFAGIIICNFRILRRMMKNDNHPEVAQIGRALLIQHVAIFTASSFVPGQYGDARLVHARPAGDRGTRLPEGAGRRVGRWFEKDRVAGNCVQDAGNRLDPLDDEPADPVERRSIHDGDHVVGPDTACTISTCCSLGERAVHFPGGAGSEIDENERLCPHGILLFDIKNECLSAHGQYVRMERRFQRVSAASRKSVSMGAGRSKGARSGRIRWIESFLSFCSSRCSVSPTSRERHIARGSSSPVSRPKERAALPVYGDGRGGKADSLP